MAQYERFLSYLFEYDQDTKGANCGFAKIEVRGETVRIQITMKERMQVELLHVCAFYREESRCVCVPLGRMMVNGSSAQFQYTSSGVYLSGSQVRFSQIKGLVLCNPQTAGKAYATVWDDEPFGLSMFEMEAECEDAIHAAEIRLPGMWRSGEEAGLLEPERIIVIRREEMPEAVSEDSETSETTESDESAEEISEVTESDESAEEISEATESDESAEEISEATEPDESVEKIPEVKSSKWRPQANWSSENLEVFWAGLCQHFPKIESLPGDSVVCLKAVPADIGRLPRPNWILGNNGFLMYSYVRFRYIVFARVTKDKFELWLPGTYEKNEEMLARMFGFHHFRSMKSMAASEGDFGYWCVPIEVPQI